MTFTTQTLGSNPGRTLGKSGAAPSLPADRVALLSYAGRALCRARSWRWCFECLAGKYQKDQLCAVLKDLRTAIWNPGSLTLDRRCRSGGGKGACSQCLVCGLGLSVCSSAEEPVAESAFWVLRVAHARTSRRAGSVLLCFR